MVRLRAAEGSCVHFEGNGAKNRHSYPESISTIQFNRRFRSYGAKVVLKKHPFCGVFLIFLGFDSYRSSSQTL
ncbi:hypothetical protein FORC31_p181 (plasmid) [Escherichia coli]|nr:hypothetical protein FORC31_p181 [Escherichia coli]